ncbi:inositol monophosphatase family protein [Microcoleus sp. FACHB-1515]|uniref:3'(2'),5'-bisphosphate nucleotidase CysQ family protein n=1 Tax=Cyanophyceae TaxID=3028117 RepID=UPI0016867501|nr:inositol monophosphatase family protein [Microcoleus sp. FACHB-1515]MBD2092056.1 inositol monophosphatase family protein [Microcoleus sp. FACHB-1515]
MKPSIEFSPVVPQMRRLLQACGQIATAEQNFEVFEKGRDDYVTSVDRALDAKLTIGLRELFPHDPIITEENRDSQKAFRSNPQRVWCVDPLDGTDDFIQRKLHYAVMLGLLEAQQPTVGWIYAPAFDQLFFGGQNWGLFQAVGDRPVEPLISTAPPPPDDRTCEILIGYKDQKRYGETIARLIPPAQFSTIGSFGLKVMQVVQGKAGIYIYLNRRVKLWDTVGPIALARAAGLICCDLAGNPLQFSPDFIDNDTLAHQQEIVIGWPAYVHALRSRLQKAVWLRNQA